jgi:hypothetical protein
MRGCLFDSYSFKLLALYYVSLPKHVTACQRIKRSHLISYLIVIIVLLRDRIFPGSEAKNTIGPFIFPWASHAPWSSGLYSITLLIPTCCSVWKVCWRRLHMFLPSVPVDRTVYPKLLTFSYWTWSLIVPATNGLRNLICVPLIRLFPVSFLSQSPAFAAIQ